MADQLVSAIIPVLNTARYLAEAIESALAQTHSEVEVIVVDGGSVDGSLEVARSFGNSITVIIASEVRLAGGRNRGVAAARGGCVAFLDADDLWMPRKLEIQLEALAREGPPALVFGHVHQFVSPELAPDTAARLAVPDLPQPGRLASTLLASRQTLERIGTFSEDSLLDGFLDWLTRALDLGISECVVPEVVLRRRRHPDSLTAANPEFLQEYPRALKTSLDRRRAAS
jgi:glycosyltransferase involved in cell wall biosynthesis